MKPTNKILMCADDGQVREVAQPEYAISVPPAHEKTLSFVHFQGALGLTVRLAGEGAQVRLNIVYLSNKNNKNSIDIKVLHEHKNTYSKQVIKGVVADSAAMCFNGGIRIAATAEKSVGIQKHRALLLSDAASVQATPRLEIYTDDVVCSHGSAVGNPDEEALFYLMSRGIPEKKARALLIHSFLCDILPDELVSFAEEWIQKNA